MNLQNIQAVVNPPKSLSDYEMIVPSVVKEIRAIAQSLKGLKVAHLNATAIGGGVAEMLRSEVPLQKDIGLDAAWYVIAPSSDFFTITKKIHNLLQGQPGKLSNREKEAYLKVNKLIARSLLNLSPKPDILLVHDPQPAASVAFLEGNRPKFAIWRCHIDTTFANETAWDFLLPYLKFFDHFIFTAKEYLHGDFPPKDLVSLLTPVIDPLSHKNIPMEKEEAKLYIQQFGIDTNKYLVTQVSRLDPWKDPLGVIDAYRLAKVQFPTLQLAMVAQGATDDPEGEKLYFKVKDYIKGEKGIFLLVNLADNDRVVNAFQTASDIVLQKSIREGFSLTVTEAMWKGAVVIGGNVGGIKLQIKDGVNGFLVNSSSEAALKIEYVLKNPKLGEKIGQNARESVKNKFLLPHATLNYLKLFKTQLK